MKKKTSFKVYPYELIGQEIEIIASRNKNDQGKSGKIIDETKFTLKILYQGKINTLIKNNLVFRLKKNKRIIEGKTILKRPEERIKGR